MNNDSKQVVREVLKALIEDLDHYIDFALDHILAIPNYPHQKLYVARLESYKNITQQQKELYKLVLDALNANDKLTTWDHTKKILALRKMLKEDAMSLSTELNTGKSLIPANTQLH